MHILILVVLAVIVVFTIMGFKVGLIRRVIEFAGLVISFLLATNLSSRWSGALAESTGLEEKVAVYIAWAIIFLLGLVATRLLAWIICKTVRISIIGWLDRLGGAVFGLLAGAVLSSVILIVLTQLPGGGAIREAFHEQPIPRMVYQAAPTLYDAFQRLGGDEEHLWAKIREKVEQTADAAADAATEAAEKVTGTAPSPDS
jgi:uncharacterized membrane protein required for colicin V production